VPNPKPSIAERAWGDVTVLTSPRDFDTGLPAEAPEPVFDEFYSTKKEGMGIGLCTAQSNFVFCAFSGV